MSYNDFDDFSPESRPSQGSSASGNGGWHWPLTLVSLLLVSALSFLLAYLTKDVQDRPVWLMGLILTLPAGAMFLSAILMEFSTGAMTPPVSRPVQIKVAVLTTLAVFVIACVCDAVYLYGGFVGDSSDNLLFLVYEDSPGNTSTDQAVMQVLDDLYARSGTKVEAGLFMFDFGHQNTDDIRDTAVPLAPFDVSQRDDMRRALIDGQQVQPSSYGIQNAYEMAENCTNGKPTRIIIICDSSISYTDPEENTRELWDNELERFNRAGISLYYMGRGEIDEGIRYLVEHSGGSISADYSAENVLETLRVFTKADGDMIRSDTHSAIVLSGIMIILEGLAIGIGLMLMLSVHGQKRFQAILSPVMAILAFVLLKIIPKPEGVPQWILEGTAFSLLGLVFMMRNYGPGQAEKAKNIAPLPQEDAPAVSSADDEW